MISIASILGPLWAGAAFELVDPYGYYPYFGVSAFLIIFILVSSTRLMWVGQIM